jgi:UrcA family protein
MEPNMTKIFAGCCSALLALGLQLVPGGLRSAQAAITGDEEVTVVGPYTVGKATTKRALGGEMPELTISVSQSVSFADLDLSKPGDVATLRGRVKAAARDSCRELDHRFPSAIYIPMESDRRECVRNATGQALARVDTITNGALARADVSNNQRVAAK